MRKLLQKIDPIARKILRPLYNEILFFLGKTTLQKNSSLKDQFRGKRCFLMATGASLKELDLNQLKNEYVIGCNLIYDHPDFNKIDWLAYFVPESASSPFLPPDDPFANGVFYPNLERRLSSTKPMMFFSLNQKFFIQRSKLFREHAVFYLKSKLPMLQNKALSHDMASSFTFMDGVGYAMIAGAMYMGFTEIYLCGYGYTYSPFQVGHFYEDWIKNLEEAVDTRHKHLYDYAQKHGVKIFNLTPEGYKSPIYPSISFANLYTLLKASHGRG